MQRNDHVASQSNNRRRPQSHPKSRRYECPRLLNRLKINTGAPANPGSGWVAYSLAADWGGLRRGMVNQKVLPSPGLDMAPRKPPSTETCFEQMLRPSPVPPLVLGRFMSSSVPWRQHRQCKVKKALHANPEVSVRWRYTPTMVTDPGNVHYDANVNLLAFMQTSEMQRLSPEWFTPNPIPSRTP